jgi:hypothetical protein
MTSRELGSRNVQSSEGDGPPPPRWGYLAWSGCLPETVEVDPVTA